MSVVSLKISPVLDLDHDGEGLRAPVSLPGFVKLNIVVLGQEEVVEVGRYRDLRAIVGHGPVIPSKIIPVGARKRRTKSPIRILVNLTELLATALPRCSSAE